MCKAELCQRIPPDAAWGAAHLTTLSARDIAKSTRAVKSYQSGVRPSSWAGGLEQRLVGAEVKRALSARELDPVAIAIGVRDLCLDAGFLA